MLLKLFVLIGFSVAIASSKLQKPITRTVETNYGGVRGLYQTSPLTEGSFYSFRGIPYAKPPIDERRFKVSFFIVHHVFSYSLCNWGIHFITRHLNQSNHGIRISSMHSIIEMHACNRIPMRSTPASVKIACI